MKELWLCRHADAQGGAGIADHERDLTPAGRRAAEALATWLAARGLRPQRVLTSSALRARRTAELVFGGLTPAPEVLVAGALYLAAPAGIRRVIAELGGDAGCLAVVGHNPGLHLLACELAVAGDVAVLARLRSGFPPTALARIGLPVADWAMITWARGRLLELLHPESRSGGGA